MIGTAAISNSAPAHAVATSIRMDLATVVSNRIATSAKPTASAMGTMPIASPRASSARPPSQMPTKATLPGIMASCSSDSAWAADSRGTRRLRRPVSGINVSQSQVPATVNSGSPPIESASAMHACDPSSNGGSRAPVRRQSATAASATARSAPPANRATAIR